MAKRKRHQRLPSGWGSIRYLGKGRRNPYAVHPPATEQDPETGQYIRPAALCYVDDWYVGFAVLNAYRAGTYHPGDELAFRDAMGEDIGGSDKLVQRILADAGKKKAEKLPTFAEVYEQWREWKCGPNAPKKLSESQRAKFVTAYKNLAPIHDREFAKLTIDSLQAVINSRVDDLGKSSLDIMKGLLNQIYNWAESRNMVEKNLARHVVIPASAKEDEHGIPLSEDDIRLLWAHHDDPDCELALCLCYSGHRIGEYEEVDVDLDGGCFRGGLKTEAGKNREVPIHPAIRKLVEARIARYGKLLAFESNYHGNRISKALLSIGIEPRHTAHDCRHTFSMLCERYGVPENDRKRLMGHAFGDVTNAVYGHRSLDDLRKSIRLIPTLWECDCD